jgi:hypothetical protein
VKGLAAAGAAAGLTLLAALFPTAAAAAAPTLVATGFLAVTTGSDSSQISTFHLDGSGRKPLTTGPANHYDPSLSPDGKQVLFTGEEGGTAEVYRMNIDGTGVVPITKPPVAAGGASWSPDGSAIAYGAHVPGVNGYQIFRAAPDGSGPVQLTHTTDGNNGAPRFSPDGHSIAYVSSRQVTTANGGSTPVSEAWVLGAQDGTGARAVSHAPALDNYPAWISDSAILFARSDVLGKTSVIISVTLTGAETAESPTDVYLTEPKPLPGGKSYGATRLTGTSFGLVTVSRSDGAALAAVPGSVQLLASTTDGGFVLTPIVIQDGDVFTIAWILVPAGPSKGSPKPSTAAGGPAPTPANSPSPLPWVALGILVVAVLVGGVVAVNQMRKRTPPPPPPLPPVPAGHGDPPLPPGGEVTRKPRPKPTDDDDVPCDYNEGWHIMLKYEYSEKYGFFSGFSEKQAGEQAEQYLRNRLTTELPGVREWLKNWADGIQCRPPCVKHVIWESYEKPHWDDLRSSDGSVHAYVRESIGVVVECRMPGPNDPSSG